MAQAVRTQRNRLAFLNSDGRSHPVENTLATVTLVLGAIAVFTTLAPGLHLVSSWVGIVGIATGLWSQFVSSTTGERFMTIIGLGASAVGLYIGIAHGGPFGGLF
ncbi:hypothetical protein [Streptomyces catenulae]|uniref:Integral membrane protein n=1 Tax=Streptomyces catenulae TaxID=66875 RepID=A0ABV2Z561_9ACTN|nr:hypothetical protein [Streptomyces catenulae]